MAQLKTYENLIQILSPLEYWSCFYMLLVRHTDLLNYFLICLESIVDGSDDAMTIELFIVIELLETLNWLRN
jgi:hypothetical protein